MIPGHVISVPFLAIFALVPLLCSSAIASSSNAAKMDRSSPPDEQLSERGKYGYISAGYFPNYGKYLQLLSFLSVSEYLSNSYLCEELSYVDECPFLVWWSHIP